MQDTDVRKKVHKLGKEMSSTKLADQSFVLKTPKGTRDRNPFQMRVLEEVFTVIQNCFKRHDAVSIETPVFELKEVLTGKYGEDSKLIYDLEDQGGELLSLRYDLTVPFARYVAMNKIKTIKRYQIGKVYRRDQPAMNRGRFREFYQCDFDIAGDFGLMMADAECLRVVYEVLRDLNLGEFVIKLNHRRFLDGLFSACGVPPEKFATTCSSVDKLDKAPWEDVKLELLQEKGLSPATVELIGEYTQITGGAEVLDKLAADPRLANVVAIQETLKEMQTLLSYCQALGIMDRLKLDMSLARGLDYYTGVIYEAVLKGFTYNDVQQATTMEPVTQVLGKTKKEGKKGHEVVEEGFQEGAVGSVAGGGRYDNLVTLFTPGAPKVPCVGVSFGIERLLAISEMLTKQRAASGDADGNKVRATETDVMVIVAHKGLITPRLEVAKELWDAKIKTAFSHKNQPKLLDQLQYCENTGIPLAVLIGDSELQRGVVKLRRINARNEREVARSELPAEIRRELAMLRKE
uniref:histidine--tRNA ligase n=1 Tax=Mesocestoides corti TaxID=53468 RepID=A0A5K3FMQ9_MESCO